MRPEMIAQIIRKQFFCVTDVPCPSFPWCFYFLGLLLAVDFLGLFECFLLCLHGFKGSEG